MLIFPIDFPKEEPSEAPGRRQSGEFPDDGGKYLFDPGVFVSREAKLAASSVPIVRLTMESTPARR